MCIKHGDNELTSVQALMSMSLDALIADTLKIDIHDIQGSLELRADLGMVPSQQARLEKIISEYFDGLRLDMSNMTTIADLHQIVVDHEFEDLSADIA